MTVVDPPTFTGATDAPNIAVDVQATGVLGEFSVDVDEVGGPALLGWGETGWLNVVCDVTRLVMRRGASRRQGPLARAEAASVTLEILDTERRFDPLLNADAVHAGTPLRVRAWGVGPVETWTASRTNHLTRPRPRGSGTGWEIGSTGGGVAMLRYTSTGGPDGGSCMRALFTTAPSSTGAEVLRRAGQVFAAVPSPPPPGVRVLASLFVMASRPVTVAVRATFTDAAGFPTATGSTVTSTPVALTAGIWGRRGVTVPAVPDDAAGVSLSVVLTSLTNVADGLSIAATMGQLEVEPTATTLGDYFDGDTPDELLTRRRWVGVAGSSASVVESVSVDEGEWSEVLLTGEVDDVPVTYAREGAPRVTLQATDVIGAQLVPWASEGREAPGVGAGDNLMQRVERVLDELDVLGGLAPPAEQSTEFSATHPPTILDRGWDTITAAAEAELGRVWANRYGELVVRGRNLDPPGTIRGTLSDWHGEAPVDPHACYDDLAATLGTELLTNRAIGQRRIPEGDETTPVTVRRDDPFSQAVYRLRSTENRSLELETDEQVDAWCEQLLATSARPELRVDSVSVAPWGAGVEAWRAVCATDLGDRWLLRHHPEIGPTVEVAVGVLGIDLEVTPDGWRIVWATESALAPGDNPARSFAVEVSELEGADELATFGGPVPAPEPVA